MNTHDKVIQFLADNGVCDYYGFQRGSNGDVAVCHCSHPGNPEGVEGNCNPNDCPTGVYKEAADKIVASETHPPIDEKRTTYSALLNWMHKGNKCPHLRGGLDAKGDLDWAYCLHRMNAVDGNKEHNNCTMKNCPGNMFSSALWWFACDLHERLNEIHGWAVCGAIAEPEDLFQNLPRIVDLSEV